MQLPVPGHSAAHSALCGQQWVPASSGGLAKGPAMLSAACRVIPAMQEPGSVFPGMPRVFLCGCPAGTPSRMHCTPYPPAVPALHPRGLRGSGGGMGEGHVLSQTCCSRIVLRLPFPCRVFMPNLVPPKIPDGERLDFDVSYGPVPIPGVLPSRCSPSVSGSCGRLWLFVSGAGHSPQAHGEGPE